MKKKPKACDLPVESHDSTRMNFSPAFLIYLSELKEHKIEYLSFLLTIQSLLITEASKNEWTKEHIETINDNLSILHQLILLA